MEALSLEIERERWQYLEKSKTLQDQLITFKSEIDELKVIIQDARQLRVSC